MRQLDLYLGDDKRKQRFRFFMPFYVSADCKALYTPPLQYPQQILRGSRLIVKWHYEQGFTTRKKTKLYRLFIDESQAEPLPRGYGDQAD